MSTGCLAGCPPEAHSDPPVTFHDVDHKVLQGHMVTQLCSYHPVTVYSNVSAMIT